MALFLLIHSWVLYIQNSYSVEFKFGGGGVEVGKKEYKNGNSEWNTCKCI